MSKKFYVDYFNEVLKPTAGWLKKYWTQYIVLVVILYTIAAIVANLRLIVDFLKNIFTKIASKFNHNKEVESE